MTELTIAPSNAGDAVAPNREAWLTDAVVAMTPWFADIDNAEVPAIRVSVGWPGAHSRAKAVGECWPTSTTEDGVAQIFVTPMRGSQETVDVLGTLLHEMVHAVDDCENGHVRNFRRIAAALGFTSKFTSSSNRSDELTERLKGLAERLGEFPSAAIGTGEAADRPKKQGTRMLKVECPEDGHTLRTTAKWIEVGLPTCPCGTEMVQA